MIRLPNLNRIRAAKREQQRIVARFERMEKRNRRITNWRKIIGGIILLLILIPLRSDDPNIAHGIASWCAIATYLLLGLYDWHRFAPLTRWRKASSMAVGGGGALLVIPFILLLFGKISWQEDRTFYLLLWGGALLMGILLLVSRYQTRRIKAESAEAIEQMRRREMRRKKLELL